MAESKRIVWLIVVMMTAVIVSTAVAITVIYRTAFERERAHLVQNADDQAHLMDAVARFDRAHQGGNPGASEAATLSQVESAFRHYPVNGQMAEIVVGHRRGDQIVFLVTHGRAASGRIGPIPVDSKLAEPMRRALSGRSGSMIGLDYRGVTVLAAYHPIPLLGAGVVAKMDLADIRAPFLRGAAAVIGLASLLVTVGAVLFVRLTNPIVKHLTESEQRYQRIFRSAPAPIWEQDFGGVYEALRELRGSGVTDLNRHLADHPELQGQLIGKVHIKEANAAALALFGAPMAAQFRAWFESTFVPATLDLTTDMLRALWAGQGALLNRTITAQTQDGRNLTVILSMLIPGANDEYHSVPVSALDVSADLNLRRREEELGLILASTGEGIFGMDLGCKCTFVNRAALRMLGCRDEDELLGRDMHALIHPACRDSVPGAPKDCPILRVCSERTPVHVDDQALWRLDGTSFPADYRSYPMLREGTAVGAVVTFTDITQRKERDAQLLQAQKMEVVGQLTGSIAHDFNNLLTIILTNLHFLEQKLDAAGDKEIGEVLGDAASAAQDAARLTRRLLAFARRQPLEPRWIDIEVFIKRLSRFLRRVTGPDIALVVQPSSGPLPVRVDQQQLENSILNLAINAQDAMPSGGTLTIAATRQSVGVEEASSRPGLAPGDYVVVSVSDTGIGMSPELARRAVEPFFTTKPAREGSGLGLSSALGFAQQSGGDLRIQSAPGEGTIISMFLPEAAAPRGDCTPALGANALGKTNQTQGGSGQAQGQKARSRRPWESRNTDSEF